MRSDTSPLPLENRFRADAVALVCGLTALPLAQLILKYFRADQVGIAILLLITSTALAAGFGTIALLNRTSIDSADASPLIRAGARAGLLTATLAAAMTVLSARLFQSQLIAMVVLVPSVLTILPGSFFGMLATAFAVGIRVPVFSMPEPPSARFALPKRAPIAIFAIACVVGFASVLIPQGVEQVVTAGTRVFAPRATATPWRYEKPAELASADAAKWDLIATRPLGRIRDGSPLLLTMGGDRFAYLDPEQVNTLKVIELNEPDKSYSFVLPGAAYQGAFSPDGNQILFAIYEGGKHLGVADINKGRVIMLPRPKGSVVPAGDLSWPSVTEAIFRNARPPFRAFDLDMLELGDAKKEVESAARTTLPAAPHAALEIRKGIDRAEVPDDQKQRTWPMTGALQMTVRDTEREYRRFFNVDVQVGDRFLGSPDASKLVRLRNNVAVVNYFGVRSKPAVSFTFEMPKKPDEHSDKSKVTAALTAGELCALVYSPLTNPLNEKIIGPDRDHVKGVIRFASWNDRSASAWLSEEFQPIVPNDVIADLHTWKNFQPELILESERRWWTKIATIMNSQRELSTVPAYTIAKSLQRGSFVELVADSGAVKVQKFETSQARDVLAPTHAMPSATPNALTFSTSAPPAQTQSTPSVQAFTSSRQLSSEDPAFQNISAFITAHHQKANRGDLNALVEDYADAVVLFDKGVVDKAYIYKNEAVSRSSFQQMAETIIYPITIRQEGSGRFYAQYSIAWEAVRKDGRHTSGTSNVFFVIAATPSGLKIVSHQSRLESGE